MLVGTCTGGSILVKWAFKKVKILITLRHIVLYLYNKQKGGNGGKVLTSLSFNYDDRRKNISWIKLWLPPKHEYGIILQEMYKICSSCRLKVLLTYKYRPLPLYGTTISRAIQDLKSIHFENSESSRNSTSSGRIFTL